MTNEKTTAVRRVISFIKIVWTVSIIVAATAIGALIGWENRNRCSDSTFRVIV
ncbi:hypothetical protein [Rhizobium leguminosarum]